MKTSCTLFHPWNLWLTVLSTLFQSVCKSVVVNDLYYELYLYVLGTQDKLDIVKPAAVLYETDSLLDSTACPQLDCTGW